MSVFQITVVGPGLIGKEHIARIVGNTRCQIHSIVSAEKYQHGDAGVKIFSSLNECFAHSIPDGVIIASPTDFHYEHIKTCFEADIKCLVEKPICADRNQAQLILSLPNSGSSLVVGHHRHHSPIISIAKSNLESGNIGELRSVMASAQYFKPDGYFAENEWRTTKGVGGVLLINAIHDIGLLRYLVGEIYSVQAIGRESRISRQLDGVVAVNLEFQNGVIGNMMISDEVASIGSWEVTSGENQNFPIYDDGFAYIFGGTKGTLSLPNGVIYEDQHNQGWLSRMARRNLVRTHEDPLTNQLDHFLDMIEYKVEPKVTAVDAVKNLLVIRAISMSLASGNTRVIPEKI